MSAKAPTKFGVRPTTAAKQVMRSWPPKVPVQPLPAGSPGRVTPDQLGIKAKDPLNFLVIGDHGGIKDPTLQNFVTAAMEADKFKAAFLYSVGDVVYFNGDASEYDPQFYEAYGHLVMPIVGIPGNHDGDTTDDPSRLPLDTWMAAFCSPTPALPPASAEYNRQTQVQPYCDWTLSAPAFTLIGLYSNVPSGGHLEQSQIDWLTAELKAAPTGVPLGVALHHPPFSIDAHHGGSKKMVDALTHAFQTSGRYPDIILSGHVHDYQRFTWTLDGVKIKTVVIGNSGYHNLHKLAPGATPGQELLPGVVFEAGDDANGGYLKLSATGMSVGGEYVSVNKLDGSIVADKGDTF